MEPGNIVLLPMFFVTTQLLRLYLCDVNRSRTGSGNHVPGHFMFSRTKSSPCQRWKAGWFVQSFICRNRAFHRALRVQMFLIKWKFFSVNHVAHSALWSLDLLADSKRGKTYHGVLSHKSQAPLQIAVNFSQWQKEDLKVEMQDLTGVFYYSEFFSVFVSH